MPRKYRVYRHPNESLPKVAKVGFSWPAFFFAHIWIIVKAIELGSDLREKTQRRYAHWAPLLVPFLVAIAISFAADQVFPESPAWGWANALTGLAFMVVCGTVGNRWWAGELEVWGFVQTDTVEAANSYEAITKTRATQDATD